MVRQNIKIGALVISSSEGVSSVLSDLLKQLGTKVNVSLSSSWKGNWWI